MSDRNTDVPRLDLAPKLKRPLSLSKPIDYLRLLYWVFFFPQALRWYVDTFGGGYIPKNKINWRKSWELLRQNPIQRQLCLQGFALTVITFLVVNIIFHKIGILPYSSSVMLGVASGLWVCLTFGSGLGVAFGVVSGVGFTVTFSVASGLAYALGYIRRYFFAGWDGRFLLGVLLNIGVEVILPGVALGLPFGLALGLLLALALSVGTRAADEETDDVTENKIPEGAIFIDISPFFKVIFISLVLIWLAVNLLMGNVTAIVARLLQVAIFLAAAATGLLAILRPENWCLSLLFGVRSPARKYWRVPHVTPIPMPGLSSQLTNWLQHDWETGIYNANQLLAYSLQFIPVIQSINRVLALTPEEQVIYRVSQLAEDPHAWRLLYSASATLMETINLSKDTETRLDTPARAAAAGFWYLYQKKPAQACEAFQEVFGLPYGKEMLALAGNLRLLNDSTSIPLIAEVQLFAVPNEPLLRPSTWQAIASLSRVVEDVKVVQRSVSRSVRAIALNRALGEIKNLLETADTLPKPERQLIINIARAWKEDLLQIASEQRQDSIAEPVRNPYVVGDPVQGKLFVGRKDIIRQLEELWVATGNQLQSVVIYGHRRMGKTSILLNVANSLGSQVKVAYVNLLLVGDSPQGVGDVLMAISDKISDAVNIPPPADADLLNLPYRTFRRYLKQVEANLSETGLIIALDEFEKIEKLIEKGKIDSDFMEVLRGMVQMSPKIAFALAGLHTLDEMTGDYSHPFFASFINIKVSFMESAATRQILANPQEDFLLDYAPEALSAIYAWTNGQPYLVQLVGFQLVRRYNDQVFEMGNARDPVFTVEDVRAVINDHEFFQRGRYYFDGVWGQAARGAPGQQEVLRAIAPHREGLDINTLAEITGMNETNLQPALDSLIRHDVVWEIDGKWSIIVQLFRVWVDKCI
ncbi:MAG: ATP-binding protein [Microcoleus sp.]